jgi:2-methylcitrate dehydratase PrpD
VDTGPDEDVVTTSETAPDFGFTRQLAEWVCGLTLADVPAETLRYTTLVLTDTCGSLLGGSRSPGVRHALLAHKHSSGSCLVIGHQQRLTPEAAALVNGIGAHEPGIDDFNSSSRTHPGAIVTPAALAVAELAEGSSGADLIAGILAGYDVTARLSKAMGVVGQFRRGFHPASVCGSVGAAAAAGRVLRLSVDQMISCLTLAVGQASGLLSWEDDVTHTLKSFQMGTASRAGVAAALLAQAGYLAKADVFTGRHNMLGAFSEIQRPEALVEGLGESFEITATSLKLHASCGQIHSSIDAVLDMLASERLTAADIEAIDVDLPHDAVLAVDGMPLLTHNIQHVLAIAAVEGHVGVEHFAEAWTAQPDVHALAARVSVHGSDELQASFPAQQGAQVTITTSSGQMTRKVPAPHGNPADPLTADQVWRKFLSLSEGVMTISAAEHLRTSIETLADAPSASQLIQALSDTHW